MSNATCEAIRPIRHTVRPFRAVDEASLDCCAAPATNVLLIDTSPPRMSEDLRRALPASTYHVRVTTPDLGHLRHGRADANDVVILCLGSVTPAALETYSDIRRIDSCVPVIFVAGAGGADAAILAMKHGAYDFLFQPVEPAVLRRVVDGAVDVPRRMRDAAVRPGTNQAVAGETEAAPEAEGPLVGRCSAMREVYKAVGRVAAHNMPVLITGESGTGKEVVARVIHEHSPRSDKPFLAINCAAIPENLLE